MAGRKEAEEKGILIRKDPSVIYFLICHSILTEKD